MLPDLWVQMLTSRCTPTGTWADYNIDLRYWNYLKGLVVHGAMSESDLPPRPDPANYNVDLTSPPTHQTGE